MENLEKVVSGSGAFNKIRRFYFGHRYVYYLASAILLFSLSCGRNSPRNPISPTNQPSIEEPNPNYAINVTEPKENDRWPIGSNQKVEWTSIGLPEDQLVDIVLAGSNGTNNYLSRGVRNNIAGNSYSITVPDVSTEQLYDVVITATIDTKVISGRSGTFKIYPQLITPIPQTTVIFSGAGDIARPGRLEGAEATGRLLTGTPFITGDAQYDNGTYNEFINNFNKTPWGLFKNRIVFAMGNHEWNTRGEGAFAYFGSRIMGQDGMGYYSTDDIGAWHIIVLNSNIDAGPNSTQARWLINDLKEKNRPCSLAIWHHPVISSGQNGDQQQMLYIWEVLYDFGVDVILNGHDHLYERFAKMGKRLEHDDRYGMREFIVGTGGHSLYSFVTRKPNSESQYNETFGILKLTLTPTSYMWEFIPVGPRRDGSRFADMGSEVCHGAPPSNFNFTMYNGLLVPQQTLYELTNRTKGF